MHVIMHVTGSLKHLNFSLCRVKSSILQLQHHVIMLVGNSTIIQDVFCWDLPIAKASLSMSSFCITPVSIAVMTDSVSYNFFFLSKVAPSLL